MTSLEQIIQVTRGSTDPSLPQDLMHSNTDQINQTQQQNSTPKCFYHSDKEISFFCKNRTYSINSIRCTLPLCQKCLPVHRLQHLNRKEIPMENVITFAECKRFILQELNSSKSRVKSNQKQFEKQILIYKEKLIEIIENTVNKLKQQLLIQDKQNSILKFQELNQAILNIEKQNSLSDIIKGYQMHYRQSEFNNHSENYQDHQIMRKHSIIDHIKFVPDQNSLIQVIQRGFLNCKFIKVQTQSLPQKINRDEYLKNENQFSKYERTPVHKLQTLITNSKNKNTPINQNHQLNQNFSLKSYGQSRENPINSFKIVEIKRQLRKSIFNQKENNPTVEKSLSFSNASKRQLQSPRILPKKHLFCDVKKYHVDDSREQITLGNKNNIYTQNLTFESRKSSESSFANRSNSHSSLRHKSNKGLSLTRQKPGVGDHYLMKQRESINKMKERLLTAENEEISYSRDNPSDWKRVVKLSESNVSGSERNSSRGKPNIYLLKTQQTRPFHLVTQESLGSDVLNPIEMRKLLMKKRNDKKGEFNQIEMIQKEYQQQLMNSRLNY